MVDTEAGHDRATELGIPDLLLRFDVVRDLGKLATGLQREAEQVYKGLGNLQIAEVVAPHGYYIRLNASHPEDPLDVEVCSNPTPTHPAGEWRILAADLYNGFSYFDLFGRGDHEVTTFFGRSISYDEVDRKVYVYNDDKRVRATYRENMFLCLSDERSHERELTRRQRGQ